MRWWELFRQAMAGAARARLRSTLTALGVAIGTSTLVSMVAFALGLQHELEAPLKKFGLLNEIYVWQKSDDDEDDEKEKNNRENGATKNSSRDSKRSAPTHPHPSLDDAALARLRAIPGVKYAYPNVSVRNVKATHGDAEEDVVVVALPRETSMTPVVNDILKTGRFFSLDDSPEVLVARALLDDLDFKSPQSALGQEIEISAAGLAATEADDQFQFQRKTIRPRIVGVFEAPDFGPFGATFGRRTVVMPPELVGQLPGRVETRLWRMRRGKDANLDSYDGVTVRAESPAHVRRVNKAIKSQGFSSQTTLDNVDDMRVAFLFIESLLAAVGSIAMIIASLGIANTLLMTVLERYEEIGLYKAIGATDGDVRLMFMAEAAVLGLVGSLVGLVLSGISCWILQWGISAYLAHEEVKRHVVAFYFPWWLLAGGVTFSTFLSIISGLYPASRAARVDPIKALRRA